MDSLNVSRKGLERVVEKTISEHPGFILFQKKRAIGWFDPPFVRIKMDDDKIRKVTAQVEIRFGLDIVKQVDSLTRLIRKKMTEMTGLSIGKVEIKIRDVYDE